MGAVITLTTDFSPSDAYVAAMKGVILGINPDVTLVDICHTIEPQNIAQAAFVLGAACHYFPQHTIHLVVVDPGVGTERKAIILRTPAYLFVAPDNGVLSYVIAQSSWEDAAPVTTETSRIFETQLGDLPSPLQAIAITESRYWHSPVSATFHGRDIFAPVAAHLSLGIPPEDFGEETHSVMSFPTPHPANGGQGELVGHVIYIDHFGNLITDVTAADLPPGEVSINIAGHIIEGLSHSYARGEGLLALIGSSGSLEIAVKNGSAASFLGSSVGDTVHIRKIPL